MKNIFKIYKNDLKDIFTNKVLLVIIIGLCILPSLYAWFNIKASWDPYGNTGNISVAVINKDSGAEIMNKKVNMGDELVKELKTNKDLGWKFVDRKKALEGVNSGKYYAYIEIPSNFSENLTSLVSKDIKKGTIIYTVNEKINAIDPKITNKGAITIQNEVNQTVVKTVSEVVLKAFKEAGIEIEKKENHEIWVCDLVMNYGDYKIHAEYESTGIKKLIQLFAYLKEMVQGGIVFIDEFDSNLHDVYLCALIEYLMEYGEGQLCFTTHNVGPMDILRSRKKSIEFLSEDHNIYSWTKSGHYSPANLYRNGMIEGSPFNIDSFDFIGVFGADEEEE